MEPYRLAIAQNVATNGRLFCILLAAANLAAQAPIGVAFSAVPVGFAWASDMINPDPLKAWTGVLKRHFALASISTAVGLAIATVLNCW